jgi:ceramide glucosyltransferase
MIPFVILLEPLSECMMIGAVTAWSVSVIFQWDFFVFYLVHILIWFICDWTLLRIVQVIYRLGSIFFIIKISLLQNGSLPFNKFHFVIGWLFRELSGPYLFVNAVLDPPIKWRNRIFKLAWGGVAQELNPRIKC